MENQKEKHATGLIAGGLSRIPQVGGALSRIYIKFSNPLNYAMVGFIGVLINYLVNGLLIGSLTWWVSNALAIMGAWVWNWSQSVGPFGWIWGFKGRQKKDQKKG